MLILKMLSFTSYTMMKITVTIIISAVTLTSSWRWNSLTTMKIIIKSLALTSKKGNGQKNARVFLKKLCRKSSHQQLWWHLRYAIDQLWDRQEIMLPRTIFIFLTSHSKKPLKKDSILIIIYPLFHLQNISSLSKYALRISQRHY